MCIRDRVGSVQPNSLERHFPRVDFTIDGTLAHTLEYGIEIESCVDALPHAFSFIILASITLSALAFVIFRKIKWF